MKIDILTLFPEMFEGFINTSIIKRARESKKIEINLINFRDYSPLNNKQVDDTPYGGGAGMILRCGHYEGFDERIKTLVDEVISIGDYILTGGEIPAMALIDSITRLIPGVITSDSLEDESFNDSLLDYPTYTKPQEYRGLKVPDILLSGNHKKIDEYRMSERIKKTKELRPDLMENKNE